MSSELNVMVVCQLKLFSDILFPGGVKSHHLWIKMTPHWCFNHVDVMECLSVMVTLHSSASTLNILSIGQKNIINFFILIRNSFPIVEKTSPEEDKSKSGHFR